MSVALQPRPQPGVPPRWPFPAFRRFTLDNGVEVLACHMQDRPIVEVRVLLDGGIRAEPLALPGIAAVASAALPEGTEARDGEQFALDIESLGARFNVFPQWTALTGALSAPVSRLSQALGLALEAVAQPAFDEDQVDRVLRRQIGMLHTISRMPRTRAHHTLARSMFESSARMALPMEGTLDGLSATSPSAVREYWGRTAVASGCTLVIVGDLAAIGVEEIVDSTFGSWKGDATTTPASAWPADAAAATARMTLVDTPGAVQTVIALGAAGAPVPLEERAAARVAAHYFGGFFGSRLNTALREERSIAYGAGASLSHRRTASALTGESSVQTDATAEAVAVVIDELRALREGRISDDAFEETKQHLVRTAAVKGKSAGSIAGALMQLVIERLPDDYYDRVADDIASTTPAAAAAVFDRCVALNGLHFVAVGDASRIAEPLRALGWEGFSVEPLV